jgi:hypothetical protein
MRLVSELVAFEALRLFLREHSERTHTLGELLDEMEWDIVSNGGEPMTLMPGLWSEWRAALDAAQADPRVSS